MMLHSYPLLISIYKGEGRMLIVPLIDHIAGYSIDSDWFISLSDLDNAVSVGKGVKSALDYIRNSPLSSLTPNERKENAAWLFFLFFCSRVSFWKKNHYVRVKINEDNQYIIHSMKKSHKRQYTYDEIIKVFILFADADAEEIGKAVIESFMESERYYNMG